MILGEILTFLSLRPVPEVKIVEPAQWYTLSTPTWEAELEDSTFGWATKAGNAHRQ